MLTLVCFVSNFFGVSSDSWWIVSNASVHLQCHCRGFGEQGKPNQSEAKLKVGNNLEAGVESIGDLDYRVWFRTCLENTFFCSFF